MFVKKPNTLRLTHTSSLGQERTGGGLRGRLEVGKEEESEPIKKDCACKEKCLSKYDESIRQSGLDYKGIIKIIILRGFARLRSDCLIQPRKVARGMHSHAGAQGRREVVRLLMPLLCCFHLTQEWCCGWLVALSHCTRKRPPHSSSRARAQWRREAVMLPQSLHHFHPSSSLLGGQ